MATNATEREFDEAATRIRELNEQILEQGRKAGNAYLDLYERTLHSVADLGERLAGASQVEFVAELAKAQAQFTRDFADASSAAAREMLK